MFVAQDAYEEMIQNLCGIFDTNCFELFPTGAGDTISGIIPPPGLLQDLGIQFFLWFFESILYSFQPFFTVFYMFMSFLGIYPAAAMMMHSTV